MAQCVNLSQVAYSVLSNGLATYYELDTVLSLEDALNLIEFYQVKQHNEAIMKAAQEERNRGGL